MTLHRVIKICRRNFTCRLYRDDLDQETRDHNDREPTETYAIWARAVVDAEGDGSPSTLSLNQATDGITLLERLLLEFKYYSETGKHLDQVSETLCTGSRFSDGTVPTVSWVELHDGSVWLAVSNYDPERGPGSGPPRAVVA